MRKSRMKELSMEVTVGAFVFMVLLALGVFTIILSSENIFTKSYVLDVMFDDVMAVRAGDKVLVRGVEVGKVRDVVLEDSGVQLVLSLSSEIRLRQDYRVDIVPSSVLGGRHISVYEGSDDKPLLGPDVQVYGSAPIDFIDEASQTIEMLREALDEGGILENMRVTMQQFRELTAKLNEGEGSFARILNDPDVYDQLKKITDDFSSVSTRLAEGKGTLGRLLSEDDQLYNELSEAVTAVKDLANAVGQGEGTLGKLTKDDALYQEAMLLLQEIRATVDDFRETAPITSFSSVFFGAF